MNPEFESDFEIAEPHEEWLELCALAGTGELAPDEQGRLRSHLAGCARCRTVMSEYRMIAREGMPLLADEFAPSDDELQNELNVLSGWNPDEAKRRLFAKLDQQPTIPVENQVQAKIASTRRAAVAGWPVTGRVLAGSLGLAASITIAVGFGAYQYGKRSVPPTPSALPSLVAEVQSLTNEKTALNKRLDSEDASLANLEKQIADRQDEMGALQTQLDNSQSQLSAATAAKSASDQQLQATAADRDSLAAKLQAAQQTYQAVQTELTNLKAQRQQDLVHYASLETEVTDLNQRLRDADARVNDDTQYLASDRDIRELMGARQLYIADVLDVDQNGDRRKPFGRVFYTKGKSLIFYAFDLDQQAGVRRTSTFQAWAREGSDKAQPVSLGIFYVDSEANRRWALKASDPKLLSEINSVFVTVEPKGGSTKPTSKPLLYAYLRTETPNHP